jgi:6-phosphogluconolactonase (cycloisomerase 2 family)
MAGPAQVSFTPDGDALVVAEKATSCLTVYLLDEDGLPGDPVCHASSGETPFGFAFAPRAHDWLGRGFDRLIVSEAFGGAPDASAVSSYILGDDAEPQPVSESVPTTETAACWIAISDGGRYAYTTNTGSGSVTGYRIAAGGELTVLDADGRTGVTGAGGMPIDADVGGLFGRTLFVLDAGRHSIVSFFIRGDGGLVRLGETGGLPAAAAGLVAD